MRRKGLFLQLEIVVVFVLMLLWKLQIQQRTIFRVGSLSVGSFDTNSVAWPSESGSPPVAVCCGSSPFLQGTKFIFTRGRSLSNFPKCLFCVFFLRYVFLCYRPSFYKRSKGRPDKFVPFCFVCLFNMCFYTTSFCIIYCKSLKSWLVTAFSWSKHSLGYSTAQTTFWCWWHNLSYL